MIKRETSVAEAGGAGGLDLEELFRREQERLLPMCLAILGNRADAEEAVQEAFLRVTPRLGRLEGDPGAYLNVVARRVCWEMKRGRLDTVALDERAPAAADPETATVEHQRLRQVFSGLSRGDRKLIFDSYAGYSYEETSARTGITAKAVSVGLSRARTRARSLAADFGSLLLPPLAGLRLRIRLWLRRPVRADAGERPAVAASTALQWIAGALVAVAMATSGVLPRSGHPLVVARANGPLPTLAGRPGAAAAPNTPSAPSRTRPGSRRRGSPEAGGPGSVLGLPSLGGTLHPGAGGQPEDSPITGFVVSPAYATDHTIYATGVTGKSCAPNLVNNCSTLYVSHDGGGSWTALTPNGFPGGTLLLPPLDPRERTIFVAGPDGLWSSTDGAGNFGPASPAIGPGAIDPSSPAGGARVVIGAEPPVLYDQSTGLSTPEPVIEPSTDRLDALMFAPVTGVLLASSHVPDTSAPQDMQLRVCGDYSECQPVLTEAPTGQDQILLAGGVRPDGHGTVLAYSSNHLWQADAAALDDFVPLSPPIPPGTAGDAPIHSVAMRPGTLEIAVSMVDYREASSPWVARSLDGGTSWRLLRPSALRGFGALSDLTYTPDGRLLGSVGGPTSDGFGLVCSLDGGTSWARRC